MQTYLKKKFHPFQVGQKNRETLYKRYFELGEIVERDIEKIKINHDDESSREMTEWLWISKQWMIVKFDMINTDSDSHLLFYCCC